MNWRRFGPNTIESEDGLWRIDRRPERGQVVYGLKKLDRDRMFCYVKCAHTAQELKDMVDENDK